MIIHVYDSYHDARICSHPAGIVRCNYQCGRLNGYSQSPRGILKKRT